MLRQFHTASSAPYPVSPCCAYHTFGTLLVDGQTLRHSMFGMTWLTHLAPALNGQYFS